MREYHSPVMLAEVIRLLDPKPGDIIADCTIGGAGHAKAVLKNILPGGHLIGIDRDEDAIEQARTELAGFADNVSLVHEDFGDLAEILKNLGMDAVDGVLGDLGTSSYQLNVKERGFSLMAEARLDMRMDRRQATTAADLVNNLSEKELTDLIYRYSDERWAAKIAKEIVRRRQEAPIETTTQLAEIVSRAIPARFHPPKIHPATRVFQSIRVALNSEMESLERGLEAAAQALKPGGRIVVLSYHSHEDRRVKQFFAAKGGRCECPPGLPQCVCGAQATLKVLTRKPVTPTPEEIEANPRARSAKLRVAEKV